MNRVLLVILSGMVGAGCMRGPYTFVPSGPAIETTIKRSGENSLIQMKWSKEWIRWAEDNDVVLEGYRLGGTNCKSANDRFPTQQLGSLAVEGVTGQVQVKSKFAMYTCSSDSHGALHLQLYAVYRGAALDPDEWQKPAIVMVEPGIR